jgi:hypothetical protein
MVAVVDNKQPIPINQSWKTTVEAQHLSLCEVIGFDGASLIRQRQTRNENPVILQPII